MVTTPSPASRSGTASPASNAEGYLLLTIQHAVVKQVFDGEVMPLAQGELRVECVSIPIPESLGKQTANPFAPSPSDPAVPTHDFWLVLHIGSTFEMPLIPETYLLPSGASNSSDSISYTIPSPHVPNASLLIDLPKPSTAADLEDLDSFEVLLRQYKSLGAEASALEGVTVPPLGANTPSTPAPENMRGKVVLVNEETGEVVGELDQNIDVDEDKRVAGDDKNRPVVLDFGNVVEGYAPKVQIQRVAEEDMDDWVLRGAHHISRGILSVSSFTQRMMTSGADLYIRNSTPRAEPVKFSPMTKATIRTTHNASVKTVKVTKSTMGMINNAIMSVVDKTYDSGVRPVIQAYDRLDKDPKFNESKPPVPPRPSGLPKTDGPPVTVPSNGTPPHASATGTKVDLPGKAEATAAGAEPPSYGDATKSENPTPSTNTSTSSTPPSGTPRAKRPWYNRFILAGEVVLSSIEASTHDLINTGTAAASSAAGHKFGPEVGQATSLLGGSVRNVAVVYIDVRGVGRRALLSSTAKGFVKARLKNGEEVRLQGEGRDKGGVQVEAGEVEEDKNGVAVIGMTEVERKSTVGTDNEKRPIGNVV